MRGRLARDPREPESYPEREASHGGKTVSTALVARALDNYLGGRVTPPARRPATPAPANR